jgi:hypothetical protein
MRSLRLELRPLSPRAAGHRREAVMFFVKLALSHPAQPVTGGRP